MLCVNPHKKIVFFKLSTSKISKFCRLRRSQNLQWNKKQSSLEFQDFPFEVNFFRLFFFSSRNVFYSSFFSSNSQRHFSIHFNDLSCFKSHQSRIFFLQCITKSPNPLSLSAFFFFEPITLFFFFKVFKSNLKLN